MITVMLALALAQDTTSTTRLYRVSQGGTELGRETYRVAGNVVERTIVIPVLNAKMESRLERNASGQLARIAMRVFNAAGDTTRGTLDMEMRGESLVVRAATGEPRIEQVGRADGVLLPQSLTTIVEAAERAAGRDTVLQLINTGRPTVLPAVVRHAGDTVFVTVAGSVTAAVLDHFRRVESPSQNVVATVWNGVDSLSPLSGMQPPRVSYDAPPGAAYTAEHVRVMIRPAAGDTFSLAGTLSLPITGRRPFPAVVMMSGSGQQDRDENLWPIAPDYRPFREYAERLAREGIAVLRYDDRAAGESGGAVGGTTADYTDDVRQLVAWLRSRNDIDAARIGLAGHSEGGIMGPLLASTDARIKAVVILAGPSKNGRDVVRDQFLWPLRNLPPAERAQREPGVEAQLDEWIGMNTWTRWFATYDPLATARRLRMPVLIQHGALDRQVTVGQADTLAAAIRAGGNRDVTVKIYPRLNHLFLPAPGDGSPSEYGAIRPVTLPAEVLDDTARWLASRLRR